MILNMAAKIVLLCVLCCVVTVFFNQSTLGSDSRADEKNSPTKLGDYKGKWALWDAEGQHLSQNEILAIVKDYGAGIYFFRESRDLDLAKLKESGLILVKTAHPGYLPFSSSDFLADKKKVRAWAKEAAKEPYVDALCLDVESGTATKYKYTVRILSEEARKRGKLFHAAPHFSLDRWSEEKEHIVVEDYNKYADIAWPWLYNRYRQPSYKEGLLKMVKDWKNRGVKIPIYPIFDWGRPSYGGVSNTEASEVPAFLRSHDVETACLFQPHTSYRDINNNTDYKNLWESLRDNYSAAIRFLKEIENPKQNQEDKGN